MPPRAEPRRLVLLPRIRASTPSCRPYATTAAEALPWPMPVAELSAASSSLLPPQALRGRVSCAAPAAVLRLSPRRRRHKAKAITVPAQLRARASSVAEVMRTPHRPFGHLQSYDALGYARSIRASGVVAQFASIRIRGNTSSFGYSDSSSRTSTSARTLHLSREYRASCRAWKSSRTCWSRSGRSHSQCYKCADT